MVAPVDVLIITALQLEYDALKAASRHGFGRQKEVKMEWSDSTNSDPPYQFAHMELPSGRLSLALARPTRMGGCRPHLLRHP